jgi:hypothetical protein
MTEVEIKNKHIYLLQITRGSLHLMNNLVEEWNRIRTGQMYFIQYKLELPVFRTYTGTPPLPTVKNVIVNGRVLCSGEIPREYWKLICLWNIYTNTYVYPVIRFPHVCFKSNFAQATIRCRSKICTYSYYTLHMYNRINSTNYPASGAANLCWCHSLQEYPKTHMPVCFYNQDGSGDSTSLFTW